MTAASRTKAGHLSNSQSGGWRETIVPSAHCKTPTGHSATPLEQVKKLQLLAGLRKTNVPSLHCCNSRLQTNSGAGVGDFEGRLVGGLIGGLVGPGVGSTVGGFIGGLVGAGVGRVVGGLTGGLVGPGVGVIVGGLTGGLVGPGVGLFVGGLTVGFGVARGLAGGFVGMETVPPTTRTTSVPHGSLWELSGGSSIISRQDVAPVPQYAWLTKGLSESE